MLQKTATKNKNLNIRTSADDYEAIKRLAAFHGQTISAYVLAAVFEKLDEWEDINAIENYEKNHRDEEAVPHSEFMKELGLR